MSALTRPSRREFLETSARISGGLVVGFVLPGISRFAAVQGLQAGGRFAPNAFVRVGSDDSVTILLAHSEMGQGIWTSLPMLIAEELDADWSKIKVAHAKAAPAYAHTESGAVIAGNQRARYGELAAAAAKLPPLAAVTLKDPKDWKLIGRPTKRLDTPEKTTGRAQFGIDVRFPGLLTAVVARPPVFGATVKSFDARAARAVPGVRTVVQVPTGVAVVADHFWAAKLGRDALEID